MSYGYPVVQEHAEPSIVVEKQLAFLIKRYLASPTQTIAQLVVKQIELLLSHPDCIGFPDNRCGYKKMLLQWRTMT